MLFIMAPNDIPYWKSFSAKLTTALSYCRDAGDAIRGRDGYDFAGQRLRVEPPGAPRRGGVGGGAVGRGRGRGKAPK